jgi:hypothetical protein
LIILIILGGEYRLWSSSLCSVTQSYTTQTKGVIFSVLYSGSWILLTNFFSCGMLSVRSVYLLQICPCSILVPSCLVDESRLHWSGAIFQYPSQCSSSRTV